METKIIFEICQKIIGHRASEAEIVIISEAIQRELSKRISILNVDFFIRKEEVFLLDKNIDNYVKERMIRRMSAEIFNNNIAKITKESDDYKTKFGLKVNIIKS